MGDIAVASAAPDLSAGQGGHLFTNIAMFTGWLAPALDVVALQDQVQSLSPDQISVCVDRVPVVPTTLVQARVDKGKRRPALVRLVDHNLPVTKDVGRRRSRPLAIIGAL
jgi:hypothetical protein